MTNGIITFEILPDGCLNGVYSNDDLATKGKIFNEIAKKINLDTSDDSITGTYNCAWFDIGAIIEESKLIITLVNNGSYKLEWTKNGIIMFEGAGWKTRDNQLTCFYREI